jgi:hypothetical protein
MSHLTKLLLFALVFFSSAPSQALPSYARRYQVSCETCHSVVPRLNRFGLAFQVNHFNLPADAQPTKPTTLLNNSTALSKLPLSLLLSASREQVTGEKTDTALRSVEFLVSDGVLFGERRGGYFVNGLAAATSEGRQGTLESAFGALQVAGKRGEWAILAGQTTGLMYQYDPFNRLTERLPEALNASVDGFALTDPLPMVRVDYFSHRGSSNPDGDYATIGVPFGGILTARPGSFLRRSQGLYAHAFRRTGPTSVGVLGYSHNSASLVTLLATHSILQKWQLMGSASTGRDEFDKPRHLSLEAEYAADAYLAVTGRWEIGPFAPYPVGTVTLMPGRQNLARLTLEASGQKNNRAVSLVGRINL